MCVCPERGCKAAVAFALQLSTYGPVHNIRLQLQIYICSTVAVLISSPFLFSSVMHVRCHAPRPENVRSTTGQEGPETVDRLDKLRLLILHSYMLLYPEIEMSISSWLDLCSARCSSTTTFPRPEITAPVRGVRLAILSSLTISVLNLHIIPMAPVAIHACHVPPPPPSPPPEQSPPALDRHPSIFHKD